MVMTVRQFLFQMYRLINASNPTVPLHGDDEELALTVLNQLMDYYSSTGLMLTIAKTVSVDINLPIKYILFTDSDYQTTSTRTEVVTLAIGSPSFTVIDSSLYFVGDLVTGAGIPGFTTIAAIFGNVITLSADSTEAGLHNLTFTHDISEPDAVYINQGRLANLDSAWLQLSGVTYPLIKKNRDDFLASWKYEPLQGLPRFIITFPETTIVRAQLYPAPSQFFTFFCRGKFRLPSLNKDSDMSELPLYYIRFFLFAVARDVCLFKGRAGAWTDRLEQQYLETKDIMEASSEVNLSIAGDEQSLLNGAWRVRAGI